MTLKYLYFVILIFTAFMLTFGSQQEYDQQPRSIQENESIPHENHWDTLDDKVNSPGQGDNSTSASTVLNKLGVDVRSSPVIHSDIQVTTAPQRNPPDTAAANTPSRPKQLHKIGLAKTDTDDSVLKSTLSLKKRDNTEVKNPIKFSVNSSILNTENINKVKFNHNATVMPQMPQTLKLFGPFPFPHDLDLHERLWLERMSKGRGSLSVEGTFLWTAGMIGTVANGAVFVTAAVSKYFRKPLHILVSGLALIDFYVTFLYIPSYTYFLVERNKDLADNKQWEESIFSYCNVTRGIFIFIASLSISIQVLIALYLFVMTCSKDLVTKVFTTRNTIIYITSVCLVNFVTLFTPTFFDLPRVDFYPNGHLCSPVTHKTVGDWRTDNFRILYHSAALVLHISELLLICFFLVTIFWALLRGKLVRIKYGRKDRTANMNYSRAIQITVIVFSCFMLLWLPLYIVNFIDPNHDRLPEAIHHMVFDLLLVKSCVNPIIYILAIKTLRFELRLVCSCKCTPEERRRALTPPKKTTTSYDGPSSIATSSCGF